MNIAVLKDFFMWMTIINLGLFIWTAVMCIFAKDFIVRVHGKMFGLSPEKIKGTLYGFLGAYKIVFIVFVFVPWIALIIIAK